MIDEDLKAYRPDWECRPVHGSVEDVGVDHGCLHLIVAQEFLEGLDVILVLR
jgi:hypothetical protein